MSVPDLGIVSSSSGGCDVELGRENSWPIVSVNFGGGGIGTGNRGDEGQNV